MRESTASSDDDGGFVVSAAGGDAERSALSRTAAGVTGESGARDDAPGSVARPLAFVGVVTSATAIDGTLAASDAGGAVAGGIASES